ncbi:MAG: hypothetical protein ACLSAF_02435 [Intestinimonas sp.]
MPVLPSSGWRWPRWRPSSPPSEQALRELEALCRDITGDRAQRETLLTGYQEKNESLTARIEEQEARLQEDPGRATESKRGRRPPQRRSWLWRPSGTGRTGRAGRKMPRF